MVPSVCTFRDGSYCKRHSNLEVVDRAPKPTASMHRVTEVADVDAPHCHTDQCDHLQGRGEGNIAGSIFF